MKNLFKNIVAVFAGLTILASCDLDLQPTTAIVYDENEPLFQSETDIDSFHYGVLASYRSLASGSIDMTTDVMVDYFNATSSFGNNYGPVHRLDNSFTPADDYVESIWAAHYSAIKNYNVVIEEVDKIENEELMASAQSLQATAYYCRASAYLTLTRLFGLVYNPDTASDDLSVPLVVEYNQDYVPVRATVEEVYAQIESDLEFAKDVLEQVPGEIGAMAPTVDALNALWARYYLDVQDFGKAFSYAKKVIESAAGYKLASTRDEMLAEYLTDAGTEPIMQMYASPSEGTIYKTIYTSVGNDEVEGKYFSPLYLPSQSLLDAYEPSDYRYTTWFTAAKYPLFINGGFYDGVYTFIKYIGNPNFQNGFIETGAHAAKPLMISEMYLIAAEAAYMDKGASNINSTKFLNELQEARKATPTDGTLENIKKEWYREMVGNGHRFVCLKRWGDGIPARPVQSEAKNLVMTGAAYDTREVDATSYVFNLPIPAYEIKITPSLGQNDGYSQN